MDLFAAFPQSETVGDFRTLVATELFPPHREELCAIQTCVHFEIFKETLRLTKVFGDRKISAILFELGNLQKQVSRAK